MLCKTCLTDKPTDGFYKGQKSKCKDCTKAAVKANRLANLEHYRAFDKARASMPHRVAARAAYAKTHGGKEAVQRAKDKYAASDAAKESKRRYLKSPHGKSQRAETMRKQALLHPERHAARTKFGNAVRDGRVIPWPVCAVPECCGKPQGHHPDYSRPLDVVWLCDKHHKAAHAIVREAANQPRTAQEAVFL